MTAYQILVAVHASLGTLALLAFWTTAVLRKGSPRHRRVGQGYLLAMAGVVVTAIPIAATKYLRGELVYATFLAYLVVIVATGLWSAWRAIRDKRDIVRYTGPVYVVLALLSVTSGAAVLALGLTLGSMLLTGFSIVGLVGGAKMLDVRRRRARIAATQPQWWLRQHYRDMIGNGVATHIAFLAIGLPRLAPSLGGGALTVLAWFVPLLLGAVAAALADRRWTRGTRPATALATTT